jgi:hypothetical protein
VIMSMFLAGSAESSRHLHLINSSFGQQGGIRNAQHVFYMALTMKLCINCRRFKCTAEHTDYLFPTQLKKQSYVNLHVASNHSSTNSAVAASIIAGEVEADEHIKLS